MLLHENKNTIGSELRCC